MVTNLPAMRETQVHSLDPADLLEKGMATHSSILAWRIPMDRGAWQTKYSCDLVIGRILYLILYLFSCT